MGERFWITGVQLGLLQCETGRECQRVVDQIVGNQLIGNYFTDKEQRLFEKAIKTIGLADLVEKDIKTKKKKR
jgi:hypothetical protein